MALLLKLSIDCINNWEISCKRIDRHFPITCCHFVTEFSGLLISCLPFNSGYWMEILEETLLARVCNESELGIHNNIKCFSYLSRGKLKSLPKFFPLFVYLFQRISRLESFSLEYQGLRKSLKNNLVIIAGIAKGDFRKRAKI